MVRIIPNASRVPHSLGNGVTGDKAVSEDGSSFGCDKAMIRVVTEHAEAAAAMFWTALETAASKSRLDFGDMIAQCRKGCEPGRGRGGVRGGRPDTGLLPQAPCETHSAFLARPLR